MRCDVEKAMEMEKGEVACWGVELGSTLGVDFFPTRSQNAKKIVKLKRFLNFFEIRSFWTTASDLASALFKKKFFVYSPL